jgi:predicted Zn finger-like uncharacterized protein
MRISCPNCSTEYEVPDAALAGRSRKLRCERCGTEWRTSVPEQAAPAEEWPVTAAAPAAWPPSAVPEEPEMPSWEVPPAPSWASTPDAYAEVPAFAAPVEPQWEPAAEGLNRFPPDAPRVFGQSTDAAIQDEMNEAVAQELNPPHESGADHANGSALPHFLSGAPGELEHDRFAELVHAARNNSIEFEPEPLPPGPKVRTSKSPLFPILLVLFVLAFVLLEHRLIEHLLPASTKLFRALGLK